MNAEQKEILKTVGSINSIYPDIEWKPLYAKRKTIEEHVADAKRLAKENNGILPGYSWLKKNGYSGLVKCMWDNPELFQHIKQENNKGKTKEEHIVDAERLAKEHGGILPSPKWLEKNGYGALYFCMRKHPELFSNIPQDSKRHTIEEMVVIAKALAKKHNGILPSTGWLQKNGYAGLDYHMRKYPERFKDIKQDRQVKTKKEHVADAERLAKEHDGILPSNKCLINMGHRKLCDFMRKYPELVNHIPRSSQRKAA